MPLQACILEQRSYDENIRSLQQQAAVNPTANHHTAVDCGSPIPGNMPERGVDRQLLRLLQLRATAGLLATLTIQIILASWLLSKLPPWWPMLLLAAEAAFYVIWRQKRQTLDMIPDQHHPSDHDGWAFFQRWHSSSHYNVKVLAVAELIKCWFDNVPTMEIKRGNAAELIARGYFYKPLDQLKAEGKAHQVEQILLTIEQVWGYRFQEGINPDLQYLDHLQEPLKISYRPLVFYLLCESAALLKHCMLLAAGFRGHRYGAYTYYTYDLPEKQDAAQRQHADKDESHPIVFLHGVGAGLLPYIPFLLRVTALGRPVLAVEYKHLSMRWTDFIPTAPEVARDMSAIFEHHGIQKASLVAHSYGNFYVSCLCKLAKEKIHSACLIDPVCCCMWSGHLISNFVYNPARSTTGLITWLIARDIHTATAVSRNFFWTDVNMWPDEVPEQAIVVLSVKDDLVPVKHVEAMLRHETNATVLLNPDMAHADFLFSSSWQDKILAEVAKMVQQPTKEAVVDTRPTTTAAAAVKERHQDQHGPLTPAISSECPSESTADISTGSGSSNASCPSAAAAAAAKGTVLDALQDTAVIVDAESKLGRALSDWTMVASE